MYVCVEQLLFVTHDDRPFKFSNVTPHGEGDGMYMHVYTNCIIYNIYCCVYTQYRDYGPVSMYRSVGPFTGPVVAYCA